MDRTEANTGTRDVTERLRFDDAALERVDARDMSKASRGPLTVSQFKGGQSNPTYRLDTPPDAPSSCAASRRARLLPGAHAVEREVSGAARARRTGFPVPRVHGLCEDESVIGTPFYVMDMVDGPDRLGSATSPA